jgi:hypothetical protein
VALGALGLHPLLDANLSSHIDRAGSMDLKFPGAVPIYLRAIPAGNTASAPGLAHPWVKTKKNTAPLSMLSKA